ncbi:MAG: trans-2-enoyl-CoA reductase family protein [Paenibacillus sp.]|nr:trans-2-enoyl-CoA reductase family protein [Paenibacillus sp.]
MIIKPRTRGFISTTAHPEGCARQVQQQVEYVRAQPVINGPKKVLVIGASAGYGLASRIVSAFGAGASTIGVYRQSASKENRTASAGWYNSAAYEKLAQEAGLPSYSVTGDAFSNETKEKTIELIREKLGQVDMVIYSVASGRRVHPQTGETFSSVLKPIKETYTNKTVNFHTGEVSMISIDPATEVEIAGTIAVMGGEDWHMWINDLQKSGVLSDQAVTIAFSYIGPELTQAVYREGTIGRAKDHLEATALAINEQLASKGGRAYVVVSKALVTQSSSAIPVVPLYISALYKVMKEKGLHEGCIEQAYRLFSERLYNPDGTKVDSERRIRIDDWEMRSDVQEDISKLWTELSTDNIYELSDLEGYRREFIQLFGFEIDDIDYDIETDPNVTIPNMI